MYPEVSLKAFKPDPKVITTVKKAVKKLTETGELYDETGRVKLKPIFDVLGGSLSYDEIRQGMMFV